MPPAQANAARALDALCHPESPAVPAALMVLAHPDDETVSAATLLPRLRLARFVYLTDGAPANLTDARRSGCATRAAYAELRRGETRSALESVGIAAGRVEFLDTVDQGAHRQLTALARWMEIEIRDRAPAVVLTHPYEGGHPDHDAAAFAVHTACRRIAATGCEPPAIVEFTSYHHDGRGGWRIGEFLEPAPRNALAPADAAVRTALTVVTRVLTPAERALKARLLSCYRSQRDVLRRVPLQLERFRPAPSYDFAAPPHPGTLLYETFGWGITGEEWRDAAVAAANELEQPASGLATTEESRCR